MQTMTMADDAVLMKQMIMKMTTMDGYRHTVSCEFGSLSPKAIGFDTKLTPSDPR